MEKSNEVTHALLTKHKQNEEDFKIVKSIIKNAVKEHLGEDINFFFVAYSKKPDFVRRRSWCTDDHDYLARILEAERILRKHKNNPETLEEKMNKLRTNNNNTL